MTRAVEIDAGVDATFRAAAATLLDDRLTFDLSDRDAGIVVGTPARWYGASGRTTFWVTPLAGDRSFVVVQTFYYGSEGPEAQLDKLDWLVARLRQRIVLGADVGPLEEGGAPE